VCVRVYTGETSSTMTTHSILREHLLSYENTFYPTRPQSSLQDTQSLAAPPREHILSQENTFYPKKTKLNETKLPYPKRTPSILREQILSYETLSQSRAEHSLLN